VRTHKQKSRQLCVRKLSNFFLLLEAVFGVVDGERERERAVVTFFLNPGMLFLHGKKVQFPVQNLTICILFCTNFSGIRFVSGEE